MSNEFEFEAGITCSFITPYLDNIEILLIAEYDYSGWCRGDYVDGLQVSPDEEPEVEVTNIKPKSDNPTGFELSLCELLNEVGDFDHLENDILESLSDERADERADYLYQLMKDNNLELAS